MRRTNYGMGGVGMKPSDVVSVHPHGSPELAADANVIMASGNGCAIMVAFPDTPPFVVSGGGAAYTGDGIILIARRTELNGKPWGPWVELFAGGHFEIEEKKCRG